jgi:hypothetical protein
VVVTRHRPFGLGDPWSRLGRSLEVLALVLAFGSQVVSFVVFVSFVVDDELVTTPQRTSPQRGWMT